MKNTRIAKARGGILATLFVLLLLAASVALYLQIVVVEGGMLSDGGTAPASVRVGESSAPQTGAMRPLPADQMALVERVFAPEAGQ